MNLEVISNESQIEKLNKVLSNLMTVNCIKKRQKLIYTTRGGAGETLVNYYPEGDFWWSGARLSKTHKYYNLIGVNPDFKKANNILVQINYQKVFRDFREGALWAKDTTGRIFLLHKGKMGGGVSGISIENIDRIYSGRRSTAYHGKQSKDCFVVCEIYAPKAFPQLVSFVKEIKKIKEILKEQSISGSNEGKARKPMLMKKYTAEFWGKRKVYLKKGKIESECDHGIIVDALKNELETNFGFKGRCTSNGYVDLGLDKKGKPLAIFEFKTSCGSQSIYTAVGQLLLHSNSLKTNPYKFAVLPDDFDKETEGDLRLLNITTIRYKWQGKKVKFLNLNTIKNVR